jgi:uroporphyrin-III C-methyltransferase
MAADYLPELRMMVRCTDEWLAKQPPMDSGAPVTSKPSARVLTRGRFLLRGAELESMVAPYTLTRLQRVTDTYAGLSEVEQRRVADYFSSHGLAELLTLKAVKAIQAASVLLVDDLVHADVLQHASPTARVIHVGKRGGCQSTPQAFIEKLMAQEALAGENVVRLKGGDPLIFGRAGEERQHLQALGIKVDVVNGITAGLAAAHDLGVALTHRAHAHGVMLITGHASPSRTASALPAVDWAQIARTAHDCRLTLVIYMGVQTAAHLQHGLLQGLPGNTPLGVVENASLPVQRHVCTQLSGLNSLFETEKIASPAIIVVGDVLLGMQNLLIADAPAAALGG